MKRPIFGIDWTGSLKRRQALNGSRDDMPSQSTAAPSSSSLSQLYQEEMLSENRAPPIKDEMSWTLQAVGEHAGIKQEKLEEAEDATASDWANWEADTKQEKLEEPAEASASDWADWEAVVKPEKFEEKEEVQNRDCEACIPDDAQQPPRGQPQQIKKKDLTADELIKLLRTGHFVKLARNLEDAIGILDSQWERLDRPSRVCIILDGTFRKLGYPILNYPDNKDLIPFRVLY